MTKVPIRTGAQNDLCATDPPKQFGSVDWYAAGVRDGITIGRQQVEGEQAALWAQVRETVQRVAACPSLAELQAVRRRGPVGLPHPDAVARSWGAASMAMLKAEAAESAVTAGAFFRPRQRGRAAA